MKTHNNNKQTEKQHRPSQQFNPAADDTGSKEE
jgi:hypothetical protein